MVKDAESHAEEDRKARELVEARNQADTMIHTTQKSLKELGEKIDAGEKEQVESAIQALQDALKQDDIDQIKQKTEALSEQAGKIAQKAYQEQGASGTEGGAQGGTEAGQGGEQSSSDEGVVDADYEEVKDENK
jgi:molecular chaperone DnaK